MSMPSSPPPTVLLLVNICIVAYADDMEETPDMGNNLNETVDRGLAVPYPSFLKLSCR